MPTPDHKPPHHSEISRVRDGSTRERILAAAVKVAAERGISGASVDEIALVANVAKGSIYYNYGSKDAIFGEVLRTGFEAVNAAIIASIDGRAGSDELHAAALAVLSLLRAHVDLAKVMAAEQFRVDRPWSQSIEHSRATVGATLNAMIARNRKRSATPVGEVAGAALFGALLGAGFHWLAFEPELPVEAVVAQLGALIGLEPPAAHR